jgi:hypothetical protein
VIPIRFSLINQKYGGIFAGGVSIRDDCGELLKRGYFEASCRPFLCRGPFRLHVLLTRAFGRGYDPGLEFRIP